MSNDDDFISEEFAVDEAELDNRLDETTQADAEARGEWRSFSILVIIMVGTIVVIWLLNPIIFGRIVPAVMGKGLEQEIEVPTTEIEEGVETEENSMEEATEETEGGDTTDESENATEEEAGEETEGASDASVEGESSSEESGGEANEEAGTEPAVGIQKIYTVKQGDTLAAIARLYEVPIQSIIDANGITNPSLLTVGAELKIPEK